MQKLPAVDPIYRMKACGGVKRRLASAQKYGFNVIRRRYMSTPLNLQRHMIYNYSNAEGVHHVYNCGQA